MPTDILNIPGEFPTFGPGHVVLATPAIWHPDAPREEAVILFRRSFILPRKQAGATVWFTASMRCELFLDGNRIARGPGRWDSDRWGVVRIALGPLSAGKHVLAARVVHFGRHGGMGQLGGPGFFLLAAEDAALQNLIGTGESWRCHHDRSRTFIKDHRWGKKGPYHVVGSGEVVETAEQVHDWLEPDTTGSWEAARIICRQVGNPWGNRALGHALRPDPLPQMAEVPQRFARVVEVPEELSLVAMKWIAGQGSVEIPAWRHVHLVLDQGELTNAYPELFVDGGRGTEIDAVAAEAPYRDGGSRKAPRDEPAGCSFYGFHDCFQPDGGTGRRFDTLWYRSFRYWALEIRTQEEPLVLRDVRSSATLFPLRQRARFKAGRGGARCYRNLWDVSWRTARLCAHETFMDCPHYEQAQFVGDSLVQAHYHYLVANDDRLARRCLEDFAASCLPDGITQSRFPAGQVQVLPTFSLFWIGMLRDFLRFRGDLAWVGRFRQTGRSILAWFERRKRHDGLLGRLDAPFTDWTDGFAQGNAPQDADGGSAIVASLLACAYRWQAAIEEALGDEPTAREYRSRRRLLCAAIRDTCWDEHRRLLADTPAMDTFSVHAQVLASLAGCWPGRSSVTILRNAMLDDEAIQPGSFYFCYHLVQALLAGGLSEEALSLLTLWETVLETTHLTTFPETIGEPRSDCHAWSVTPPILFLEGVLGIRPADKAIGMDRVVFAPCLCSHLESASGSVPTPHGPIDVELTRKGGNLSATISTPVPVSVAWRKRDLRPGKHILKVGESGPLDPTDLGSTRMTRRILGRKAMGA